MFREEVSDSAELASQAALDCLRVILKKLKSEHTPVLLMLSGGSWIKLLDQLKTADFTKLITVSVLDERYDPDPHNNNFAQIRDASFFQSVSRAGCQFFNTTIQNGETQKDLARRWNSSLVQWFEANPAGRIVATVGIGTDGHISGIMPFPEDPGKFTRLFNSSKKDDFIVSYDAKAKNRFPLRVSTNLNFINKIDFGVVYAVGKDKSEALNHLRNARGSLASTPARVIRQAKGEFVLFTDQKSP